MTPRIAIATAGCVLAVLAWTGPSAAADDAPMGWLGAALEPAPERGASDGAIPGAGVRVTLIVDGSPADKAGLRGHDLIVGVDGMDVSGPADMIERIKRLPPDSWVGLRVLRRGAERQIDVRLGTRPSDPGAMRFVRGWLGVRTMEIPPKLREHFGAPEDAGVMVSDIVPGGPAEACGLDLGDVVYALDGEPVTSVGALYEIVGRAGAGNEVELSVGRGGARLVLTPVVGRAPAGAER